ncbi:hypothetical protein CsatB_026432 [Cannabis sativa]
MGNLEWHEAGCGFGVQWLVGGGNDLRSRIPTSVSDEGVQTFQKKGKLCLRFTGPFEILKKVELVAYRLALSLTLLAGHNMFHVSILRISILDPTHVLSYENLELQHDLSYEEQSVHILDRKDKVLRNRTITLVKVLWKNTKVEEATWELESNMRTQYPEFFMLDFEDKILLTRG